MCMFSATHHAGVQIAPGVQMFRPGEMQLTPEEEQVLLRDWLSTRVAVYFSTLTQLALLNAI